MITDKTKLELVNENQALKEQIATLGWQVLTPETEWEPGTLVGWWAEGEFGYNQWPKALSAVQLMKCGGVTFCRLNPPKEPPCQKS